MYNNSFVNIDDYLINLVFMLPFHSKIKTLNQMSRHLCLVKYPSSLVSYPNPMNKKVLSLIPLQYLLVFSSVVFFISAKSTVYRTATRYFQISCKSLMLCFGTY